VSAPIELAMVEALRLGRYISEHASFSLVNELESVTARIAEADPERAAGLYGTFIAACYEKGSPICYRVTTGFPPVSADVRLFRSCSSSVAVAIAGCTHGNRRVTRAVRGSR